MQVGRGRTLHELWRTESRCNVIYILYLAFILCILYNRVTVLIEQRSLFKLARSSVRPAILRLLNTLADCGEMPSKGLQTRGTGFELKLTFAETDLTWTLKQFELPALHMLFLTPPSYLPLASHSLPQQPRLITHNFPIFSLVVDLEDY